MDGPNRSIEQVRRRTRRGGTIQIRHVVAAVPVLLGIVLFGFSNGEPGTPPNSLTPGTQPQFVCARDEAYITDGFSSTAGACQKVETMPPGAGRDTAVQTLIACGPRGAAVTVLDYANAEGECRR